MNFKLEKKKALGVLIAGVVAFLLRSVVFQLVFGSCIGKCRWIGEIGDGLQALALTMVFVYLIWSVLDKKEEVVVKEEVS